MPTILCCDPRYLGQLQNTEPPPEHALLAAVVNQMVCDARLERQHGPQLAWRAEARHWIAEAIPDQHWFADHLGLDRQGLRARLLAEIRKEDTV